LARVDLRINMGLYLETALGDVQLCAAVWPSARLRSRFLAEAFPLRVDFVLTNWERGGSLGRLRDGGSYLVGVAARMRDLHRVISLVRLSRGSY